MKEASAVDIKSMYHHYHHISSSEISILTTSLCFAIHLSNLRFSLSAFYTDISFIQLISPASCT